MLKVSEEWKAAYPGAAVGVLVMRGVCNPAEHEGLDRRKDELERELRAKYAGLDARALKNLEALRPYAAYYKRFDKSYHVALQLESVVLKGKPIPRVAALVEAMFMAELKDLLLTAGHDLAAVRLPLTLDIAGAEEQYLRISGQEQLLKAGDMRISDREGVISAVLHGPDSRTRITPDTREALFTTYAPPGVGEEAVQRHLEEIRDNVLVFSLEADVEVLRVHGTA